ncbi:hypothetical protein VU06_01370, partial [Desulfobulbus sp. F3]|nr:hypothetical protein [Desulfobulbus sp. F3]
AVDEFDDNDYMEYGLVVGTKLQNDWTLKGYVRYDDDQRELDPLITDATVTGTNAAGNPVSLLLPMNGVKPHKDKTGAIADVFLTNEGANCDFGFHAELAYKAADVQGTDDDGMGGYVMLSKAVSSQFTPAVLAGATKDGYMADNDFGFVMVGGDTSTQVMRVGQGGDLLFGAFVANYKVSDRMTLTGNLLYADFDNDAAGSLDNAIEVSGVAGYALNESANLTYKAGYLTPTVNSGNDAEEDPYFAHYLRLNITF